MPWGAASQGDALAAWGAHRDAVLTLVVTEVDVGLPLALEVSLLRGNVVRRSEQGITTKVPFALKRIPRFCWSDSADQFVHTCE